MTIVLGIDTATTGCAAALVQDGACLAEASERMARGQSEALPGMIDDVVDRAGVSFGAIDAIAVTRGPGAFTGLRIGLAAARAMALAIDCPCLGIGTFDVLLRQAEEQRVLAGCDTIAVCIESKREELFIAIFDSSGAAISTPAPHRPDAVARLLGGAQKVAVIGDAGAVVADELRTSFIVEHINGIELPDPKIIAVLGAEAKVSKINAPATPLYLRLPDVSLPKPQA